LKHWQPPQNQKTMNDLLKLTKRALTQIKLINKCIEEIDITVITLHYFDTNNLKEYEAREQAHIKIKRMNEIRERLMSWHNQTFDKINEKTK